MHRPGDGISITYERRSETVGRSLGVVIVLGLMILFMRIISKNVRINMDSMNPFSSMTKAEFTLIDPQIKKGQGVKFNDVAGLKEQGSGDL